MSTVNVVVISFCILYKTCNDSNTILEIIPVTLAVNQAGLVQRTNKNTFLGELVFLLVLNIGFTNYLLTLKAIAISVEAVHLTVDFLPHSSRNLTINTVVIGTEVITSAVTVVVPYAGCKSTILFELIGYTGSEVICTGSRSLCRSTEVIPLTCDLLPAGSNLTELGVTVNTSSRIVEYAGKLSLCIIDTILTEVVVVAVDLLYAGELFAVLIVSEAAILNGPAFLIIIRKGVAILEGGVNAGEVSAGFAGKIRILEGLEAEDFLVLRLLCEGVESVSSEVCRVAESTGVNNVKTVAVAPLCVILRSELDTGYHAKRICICGVNRMSLVNPVKLKSYCIGFLIESNRGKREVFVTNVKLADINDYVIVKVDSSGNFGKNAYTLCKLEKEVPSGNTFHICAGKHVNEILELIGNSDLRHIDSKDIRCGHLLIKVDSCVSNVVLSLCVENVTEPCELTVAAGSHVEVEGVLTLLEHVKSDCTTNALVFYKASGYSNYLNAGILITYEYVTVEGTVLVVVKKELNVAFLDCNGLVVEACSNGKNSVRTVNCIHVSLSEVYVLGSNYLHFSHADNLAVEHHVNLNGTVTKTGEYAILGNGCKTLVGNSPGVTLGKCCLVTSRADTLSDKLNGSANGRILVFAINNSVIELGRAGCGGNHHKRGCYRTSRTVGGSADNAEAVITRLLCNVGSRSTAVKVNCVYAACLEHDLCDFLHATTTGEGLLTTVEYHKYYLTGLGDTNCCTACTSAGVGSAFLNYNLAVLNESSTEASDSLLYSATVNGVVLLGSTDYGRAVVENTEEAVTVNCMVLNTTHYKYATGFTGRHVITCAVGCGNYIVVGDVVLAVGIAVLVLSCVSLIKYTLHAPTCLGIILSVVGKYMHVISGNIRSSNVVNHLLSVSGGSVMDCLGDTGSELSISGIECVEVGVSMVCYVVTCELTYIVCECITYSGSECVNVLCAVKVSGTLKSSKKLVGEILCVNSVSNLRTSAVGVKSVSHEVSCSVLIGEILSNVVSEDICERVELLIFAFIVINAVVNGAEHAHYVVSVKVAVKVELVEAGKTEISCILKEVLVTDKGNHILKAAVYAVERYDFKKVNKVACPTAYVSVVKAALIGISNIHGTEYVTEVSLLTIGKSEVVKILKTGYGNVITVGNLRVNLIFHSGYELSKVRILVTCHNAPRTGVVTLYAGTDVLDNESYGVLRGILLNVDISHFLKKGKIEDEFFIGVGSSLTECGDNLDFGSNATKLTALICLVTVFGTGRRCCGEVNPAVSVVNYFLLNDNLAAYGTVATTSKTGVVTICYYFPVDNSGVTLSCYSLLRNENLAAYGAVATYGKTGFGTSGCYCCVNYCSVTESLNELGATYGTVLSSGTGCCCACGVTLSCYNFLLNENLVAYVTVATLGKTGFGTVGRYCCVNCYSVTERCYSLLRYENLATYRTVATLGKTGFGTSGCYCCVNYCGVTERCYSLLLNENLAAYRTVATLGKTGFGTVGRYCCVNCYSVTERCYSLLRYENLAAYRTVAALGKTGFGTVGRYCCVNYYGVTKCCYFVCNVAVATYGTSISGVTSLGTSRCCYFCIIAVTKCCYFVCNVAVATYRTSISGVTGLGTSRCCYFCIIAVTKRCFFVIGIFISATRTGVSGVTLSGTSRCCYYCVVAMTKCCFKLGTAYGTSARLGTVCFFTKIMSGCCYLVCYVAVATYRTSISGVTLIGTGRCCYFCIIAVTKCCYLVCNVAVATYRTSISGVTLIGTGRCCYFCIIVVTLSCYLVCNVAVATSTSVSGVTSLGTGGCCNYCVVAVTKRCIKLSATYGTGLSVSTGCICAGSVTLSRYLVCNVAVATSTSVSGVTLIGTSRCCYFCIVAVTKCCYLVCNVAVATYRTSISGVTSLGTGRCCYYRVVLVTKRRYLVCNVAVATSTGISGVTLIGTSRCCHYCIVAVTLSCYLFSVAVVTYGTGIDIATCLGTGGSKYYFYCVLVIMRDTPCAIGINILACSCLAVE